MDYTALLKDWTSRLGPTGSEIEAARAMADAFAPYCEVLIDASQNMIARMGEGAPHALITAHLDEIAMMAILVEDDGAIRFTRVGGTDPRTLPGSRVWVWTEADGTREKLPGVIGALPPHLLTQDKRDKHYELDSLYIDIGLPADAVKEKVLPGTLITLDGDTIKLANERISSKTLDDRAGVAAMLRAAELLSERKFKGTISFVAASQEENGGPGAGAAAYALNPNCALAIDMAMGKGHAQDDDGTFPLDTLAIGHGPFLHPKLTKFLADTAKAENIKAESEYASSATWTNADDIQIAREGIPVALLGVPTLYMHTPVETASADTIEQAARLIAAFAAGLAKQFADKEDWLCAWND